MNPVFMQKHSRRISPGHRGGSAGVPGDPGDLGCRLRTPPLCIGRPRGLFSDIQPISRRQGDIRGIRRRQRLPGWRNGGTQPAGSPGKEAAKGGSPWARRGARAPGAARRAPPASGGGHPLPSADFLSPVFTAHARRLGSQQTQKDARDSGSASPRRRKAVLALLSSVHAFTYVF